MKNMARIIHYVAIPTLCLGLGGMANATASDERGYAFDSQNVVVKDNYGDCVRSAYQDKDVPAACGGVVAATPKPPVRVERAMPVPTPAPMSKTVLEGKALFDTNRSVLKPAGRASVDKFARDVKSVPNVQKIHVIGYTDSRGSPANNQILSERRATSVKNYLEGKGLSNITAEGRGERDPVATNATKEGQAKNRRVEIEVISR